MPHPLDAEGRRRLQHDPCHLHLSLLTHQEFNATQLKDLCAYLERQSAAIRGRVAELQAKNGWQPVGRCCCGVAAHVPTTAPC